MRPKLLEIPLGIVTIPINAYGFCLMIGFLVGLIVCSRRGKKLGISSDFIVDMTIWIMISAILGSRVGYVIQFRHQFDLQLFNLGDGGINVYGGILGWMIPLIWYVLAHRRVSTGGERKVLLTAREMCWLLPLCVGTAILGARGGHLLLNHGDYDWGVVRVWEGGLAFYGGVILSGATGLWFVRRAKLPMLRLADLVIPEVALGYGITRVGCFLNGCCYGVRTDIETVAVRFPRIVDEQLRLTGSPAFLDHLEHGWITEAAERSLGVHPTQIYSTLWGLSLFVILSVAWYRRKREGEVFAYFGILYPIERFLMEFLRADNQRATTEGFLGWVTIWQWVSVGMFVSSIIFFLWVRRQPMLVRGAGGDGDSAGGALASKASPGSSAGPS